MSAKVRDMTKGNPGRLILVFAVPLMIGNVFQQLYTMVDTVVVGQVAGVQALAALGAVEWIMWMVLGVSSGITQGFAILMAQDYGARKWNQLKKTVAHSYVLTAITAVLLFLTSQIFAHWILSFLNTPDNIIGMSLLYLRIVFCGIPVVAAYNVFAGVLRSLGNSRTPLVAMVIAAGINIVLDLVFVAGLHMGVAGAALATVIAQCFSALYCFIIVRKIEIVHITKEDFRAVPGLNRKLLSLGTPILFQDVIISVGGTGCSVRGKWIWFSFCCRFYCNQQAVWHPGNGSNFLWICYRHLCRTESWCRTDLQNQKRCSCQWISCLPDFCFYFCYDVYLWEAYSQNVYLW